MVIVDWRGDGDAPRCLSARHGRIIGTSVLFSVDGSHYSTVGDVVTNLILHLSLEFGSEEGHFRLRTRVPNDFLNETLASADRIVVNLGGGGEELHRLCSFDPFNIHGIGCLCHHSGQLEECHTNGGPMTQPTILFLMPLVTGVTL